MQKCKFLWSRTGGWGWITGLVSHIHSPSKPKHYVENRVPTKKYNDEKRTH